MALRCIRPRFNQQAHCALCAHHWRLQKQAGSRLEKLPRRAGMKPTVSPRQRCRYCRSCSSVRKPAMCGRIWVMCALLGGCSVAMVSKVT